MQFSGLARPQNAAGIDIVGSYWEGLVAARARMNTLFERAENETLKWNKKNFLGFMRNAFATSQFE